SLGSRPWRGAADGCWCRRSQPWRSGWCGRCRCAPAPRPPSCRHRRYRPRPYDCPAAGPGLRCHRVALYRRSGDHLSPCQPRNFEAAQYTPGHRPPRATAQEITSSGKANASVGWPCLSQAYPQTHPPELCTSGDASGAPLWDNCRPNQRSSMSTRSRPPRPARAGLHPRNRHQGRYDLQALARACPTLRRHIIRAADGSSTLDFSQPAAVLALNQALLQEQYGIRGWTLPEGYLCPPVPGRADYIHALADLLGASHDGKIPTGDGLVGLDVGTGANLIYPLLGRSEYGWRFVGSDIDQAALANAAQILAANPTLTVGIELRHQSRPEQIFAGLVGGDERFDFTLCNPPFHADLAEATRGSQRKWRNLGRGTDRQ